MFDWGELRKLRLSLKLFGKARVHCSYITWHYYWQLSYYWVSFVVVAVFFCLFTCFFNVRIREQWCENLKAKCHYIFDVVGKCSKEPSNWKITQSSFWNLTLDNTLVIKRELYWFEWMVDNLNKWINQWVASINEWSVMRNYGLTWIITWWHLNKLSEYSELSVT